MQNRCRAPRRLRMTFRTGYTVGFTRCADSASGTPSPTPRTARGGLHGWMRRRSAQMQNKQLAPLQAPVTFRAARTPCARNHLANGMSPSRMPRTPSLRSPESRVRAAVPSLCPASLCRSRGRGCPSRRRSRRAPSSSPLCCIERQGWTRRASTLAALARCWPPALCTSRLEASHLGRRAASPASTAPRPPERRVRAAARSLCPVSHFRSRGGGCPSRQRSR
mmetsp:Transcript_39149/g.90679  ORF Transcript_39149/g.90679 Transcript_39149/m.90679 type:complete len:222 (+) Transcript_39149:261-926(+)